MSETSRLLRATEALRGIDTPNDHAHNTRARILATVHDRRVRRQRVLGALVVFMCVSVGSTAWAAVTGYLPRALRAIGLPVEVPSASPQTEPVSVHRPRVKRVRARHLDTPPAVVASVVVSDVAMPAEVPARAEGDLSRHGRHHDDAQPTGRESPSAMETPVADSATSTESRPDRADVIYEFAHRAHFVDRNPTEALPLWDAYLRDAPHGRFVPEAEYNRALCLVRLDRRAEAITALEAIAARTDGYRAVDAMRILTALRNRSE